MRGTHPDRPSIVVGDLAGDDTALALSATCALLEQCTSIALRAVGVEVVLVPKAATRTAKVGKERWIQTYEHVSSCVQLIRVLTMIPSTSSTPSMGTDSDAAHRYDAISNSVRFERLLMISMT